MKRKKKKFNKYFKEIPPIGMEKGVPTFHKRKKDKLKDQNENQHKQNRGD